MINDKMRTEKKKSEFISKYMKQIFYLIFQCLFFELFISYFSNCNLSSWIHMEHLPNLVWTIHSYIFYLKKIVFFFTFNNITNLLKSHQNAFLDKSNHRKCVKLILTAFSDETKTHQYEFLRRNWSSTKIAIAIMVIILIYNKKEKPTTTTIDENSPWFVLIIMHPFHIQESHLQDLNHL